MHKIIVPTLVFLSLLAGCAASQSPTAELPWRPDASIGVGEYRLAARGTMPEDDVVKVELRFVRVGDPSRILAAPILLVRAGETGEVVIDGGSTTVSALVRTEASDSTMIVVVDGTIAEDGVTRSRPQVRFAIDPSTADLAKISDSAA